MNRPAFEASPVGGGLHWLRIANDVWKPAYGAHVYVVGNAEEVVIIDTAFEKGEPHALITGYLAGLGSPKVKAILLTHHHGDHSEGARWLREATGAPIWCHVAEGPLVTTATERKPKEEKTEGEKPASAETPEGKAAEPPKEDLEPREGTVVDGELTEGQVIVAGGVEIVVVHTPGHSPGHLCYFLPQSGTMLTGDLVLGSATTSVSPPHGNMGLLLKSLARLLDFPMVRIAPAHGPLIDDPIDNVKGILAHRKEREDQVLAALDGGNAEPKSIVKAVYIDLDEKLVELAGRQVTSILLKLQDDGAVESSGEGDERTWRRTSSS